MDKPQLTPRERSVFDFIYDELAEGAPCPTLAEIGDNFDFHPSNAWRIVFSLRCKGYLDRKAGRHRGLEVTEVGHEDRKVALVQQRERGRARAPSASVDVVLRTVRLELEQLSLFERTAVLASLRA